MSFVGRHRQWFKARLGVELDGTRRSVSMCTHALDAPGGVLVVPDATEDPRFADNPLVAGPTHVRFYAGVVIASPDGFALGTVCVVDIRPRVLARAQLEGLRSLGRRAEELLAARRRGVSWSAPEIREPSP